MKKRNLRRIILQTLDRYSIARNSDTILQYLVYSELGLCTNNCISLTQAMIGPSFESIRRYRQSVQADGRYLATEDVRNFRKELREEYYQEYSKHDKM